MKLYSLDHIVKSVLLAKGYSLHFYMQCLLHARNCLRELVFDDLRVVKTVLLDVNDYYSVSLPCDLVDVVRIGVLYGQHVRPLVEDTGINRLNNLDSAGLKVPYYTATDSNTLYYGYLPTALWGGGTGSRSYNDTYKFLPERKEIQLNEGFGYANAVLEYISDSSCADSATAVDPYAQATIEAYIKWQLMENNRTYGLGEKRDAKYEYITQRKILRARKDPLTTDMVRRIFQRSVTSAPK